VSVLHSQFQYFYGGRWALAVQKTWPNLTSENIPAGNFLHKAVWVLEPAETRCFLPLTDIEFWLSTPQPSLCLADLCLFLNNKKPSSSSSSSSSSCSLRVRCVPCSLVLKVQLVPPSLLLSSNVPSSFWSVFQCLSL